MVLQVAFDEFGAAVKRVLGDTIDAYVCQNGEQTVATSGKSGDTTIVVATTGLEEAAAKKALSDQGMTVYSGRWTDDLVLTDLEGDIRIMYVAGVGFKAVGGSTGVWLDAFPSLPTQVQVLRAMFEELSTTGEMAEVSFEEFIRLAEANVVIASPNDLKSYVTSKISPQNDS